jgi:short-chain fatty acids transporter
MIAKLGATVSRVFERTAPDPFVLAVLLTGVTFALALAFGSFPAGETARASALLDAWRGESGLWRFLAFAMQMCLILVTGHALAESRPVRRLIGVLAGRPRGAGSAAVLVGLSACAFGLINWGLGLIVGALLVREVGRSLEARGVRAHYPLLAAAGYTGMLVWHGGLSGSAPLTMTTRAGAEKVMPTIVLERFPEGVPLGETIFSPMNLVATAGLLVIVPVVLALMTPGATQAVRTIACSRADVDEAGASGRRVERALSLPDRLLYGRWVAWGLGLALLAGVVRSGAVDGAGRIGLNEVNGAMLGLGLMLHGSLGSYARAAEEGARGCVGIILQFPLYAGIMAMLVASGLIENFSRALASLGGAELIPFTTFLSAGVVNLFVPSGGGQWAIQGPIALEAGASAGLAPGKMIMAVAYGDQLTNMLQPFWALPLLAITGVKAREIVGYTGVVMLAAGVWLGLVLLLF